jgi:hypothetical protein
MSTPLQVDLQRCLLVKRAVPTGTTLFFSFSVLYQNQINQFEDHYLTLVLD